ncbi:hypothetical protein PQ478_08430 [Alkalihalophilus pseudofirmus]|uniref:hypothetical protein n=1 Tax=Alkalihalophilus pseudofirmus TaxID=79885 RepID=UPI00259B1E23|nr:hypothetical protein [Alkalihalophilus pseudofirmus]WEG18494.1 hypothetical protein PQ478_08430 [Alkalihalophilus pseudofirmus]
MTELKYTVETTPTFEAEFRKLLKKYPKMVDDYEELLADIEDNGNLGEDIQGVANDGNKVFKKRMKNSSANKGLSGGFRVIEYLVTSENTVYLLNIYSKNKQEDIPKKMLIRLIRKNKLKIEKARKD